MAVEIEKGHILGARQGIIHEGARHHLATLVIDDALHHRLAKTLDNAAMQLPGHQHRVDDRAEIVHGDITVDTHHACFRVDLDFGDMAAIGEGGRRAFMHMADIEAVGHFIGKRHALTQFRGEFHDSDGAVGADDGEVALHEFDIRSRRFQHMGGDDAPLLDHLVAGLDDRCTAGHDRFRAARAATGDEFVTVALEQIDLVERYTEPAGEHLREGGGMALPVIESTGDDGHRAVLLEADAAHFIGRRRGHLEVLPDADAPQHAAFLTRAAALAESFPVAGFQRLVEHGGELAAVIDVSAGVL